MKHTEQSLTSSFHSILSNENDLLKNKYGIIIDDELKFNLDIETENTLTLLIRNTGNYAHMLKSSSFVLQKTPSQLSIISPTNIDMDMVINPSEIVSYTIKCEAKFVGRSEELIIFNFKDFKIGRLFHITVNAKNVPRDTAVTSVMRKNDQKINLLNLDEINEPSYIPGIRPCKPPAFIKKRTGIFKVPRYIWNVALNLQNDKTQVEREITLANEIPSLMKSLSIDTYKERFHALLYLEETAMTLNLQQYEIESAIMRRHGEYLVLEVPGLAEKRPSLITGDRAIISFQWDSSRGNINSTKFFLILFVIRSYVM